MYALLLLSPAAQAAVTVHKGDTLFSISRRVGLSVEQLRRINHLKSNTITLGQVLRTGAPPKVKPQGRPSLQKAASNKSSGNKAAGKAPRLAGRYTIRKGDTLSGIAKRTGSSVAVLQQANHLSSTTIRVGQRLTVPPANWKPARAKASQLAPLPPGSERRTIYSYILAGRHDTFASLQAKSGRTKAQFMALNHLRAPQIFAGMRVLLPRQMIVPRPPAPIHPPAQLIRMKVRGIPVQMVRVDLRHRGVLVSPVLPSWGLGGGGARVSTLARQSGAMAVINGSYFDPRSYVPAGDLVVHGRQLSQGRLPAALYITPDNRAAIGSANGQSWKGMETVIASGPQLVRGGVVQNSYSSVFRDPAVFGSAQRSAIGLVGSRDLLLVTTSTPLSVGQMGHVMSSLGARDALLLDGGSSAGLAWNGAAITKGLRGVAYGIGVYSDYQGRRFRRN